MFQESEGKQFVFLLPIGQNLTFVSSPCLFSLSGLPAAEPSKQRAVYILGLIDCYAHSLSIPRFQDPMFLFLLPQYARKLRRDEMF